MARGKAGRLAPALPRSIELDAAPAQGRCREPELESCYFGFCESVGLLGLFGLFGLLGLFGSLGLLGLFGSFGLFVVLVLVEPELSTLVPIDPEVEVPAPTLPVPVEDVPAPTPVVGDALVGEPVVAELSVEVPVVAFPLELAPVFGSVLGLAPTVALPVALVSEPVVDPLTLPLVPARVSSPVVPGVAVPVVPVALPVPVPVPEGFTGVPALVVPGEPALVPPPVCARAPAAARAAAARIVPVSLPILITSSFAADHGHGARVCEPAEKVGSKKASLSPVRLLDVPALLRTVRRRDSPRATVYGAAVAPGRRSSNAASGCGSVTGSWQAPRTQT